MTANSCGVSFQSDKNILQLKIYTQLCEYSKKKKNPLNYILSKHECITYEIDTITHTFKCSIVQPLQKFADFL